MIVVPSNVRKNGRRYKLIKIYKQSRYALYQDEKTKTKISFTFHELGLIRDNLKIMRGFKRNPQKVKF